MNTRSVDSATHWSELDERGSPFAIRLLFAIYRTLGRAAFTVLLYPVVAYFFLTAGKARRASREYLRAIRARCEELGLGRNVTFLGSRADIPEILRAADIGLLPSRSEGGPIAILEYMAAGLPFISTRTGYNTETAADLGVPGIVPLDDPDAFRAELEVLVAAVSVL